LSAFYNDTEPFACDWLEALIAGGHIANGRVERRSISELEPAEIGDGQAHFFAGIGGWSYALRLAGWPDDAPVWTGSCPCQPFSVAGKGSEHRDERHLWPAWLRLVRERRPKFVFGEQVAGRAGERWLDAVQADLEAEGYAFGSVELCAAGVGAPHIRQRLYFVAHADDGRRRAGHGEAGDPRGALRLRSSADARDGGETDGLAHANGAGSRLERRGGLPGDEHTPYGHDIDGRSADGLMGDADLARPQGRDERRDGAGEWAARAAGLECGLADPNGGVLGDGDLQRSGQYGQQPQDGGSNPWSLAEWLPCRDGKARLVEPGIFPLAHGVSGRVGRLRGYGNAIVPQVAAAFVRAAMKVIA
jgi:DNA (cytosine-5)-methyltransferase 1